MYRRDLRDTDVDGLLADMATVDSVVQAVPEPAAEASGQSGTGRIAYAKAREGQIDLWLLDDGDDVRLTSEGVSAMRYGRGDPQWFDWHPDGERIAFVDGEGSLSTVDPDSGAVETLTGYDDADLGLAWSPDGDDIAVVTDHFSRASLALVAPDGSRVEAIADDEFLYGDPWWDGDAVVAVRAEHRHLFDYESALVRVDRDGVETLFQADGVRVQNPRPRPDSDQVAFVHDGTGFDAVYVTGGEETEQLYDVEGAEVADPAWDADGDRLAVTVTEDAAAHVHVVRDGKGEALTGGSAFHTAPRWYEGDVVAVGETARRPPAVRNVSTGVRLSPNRTAGLAERLTEAETLFYRSGGREVQAVVYPPAEDADDGTVPVLVKAHGGPTSFDRFRFDFRAQYFAALGYAVILPNYRGSDGYGRDFRNANDHAWGAGDLDDVVAAADALADAYDAVDGDRAGIYGGSGGGLMTVNALGRTDRFDAGAAFYGVYDYESFVDDTDDVGWQLMKRELGDLSTDLENYRDASPIRSVSGIEDPLLVLHGEEDARVPISQSEQLVEELEAHGKRYDFQRYEGEPHGFGGRDAIVDAYGRVADLFAKYLQVDPDDGSSRPNED